MDRTPVTSSNIASIGYDPETATLEIEFLGDGSVYQYFDVPEQVHEELMAAASHGSYLARRIKGAYQYARL